jgi:hypothetical protein
VSDPARKDQGRLRTRLGLVLNKLGWVYVRKDVLGQKVGWYVKPDANGETFIELKANGTGNVQEVDTRLFKGDENVTKVKFSSARRGTAAGSPGPDAPTAATGQKVDP